MSPFQQYKALIDYLKELQMRIISRLQAFESTERFDKKIWRYEHGEGGGEICVLRGKIFEKAAVNWSGVAGDRYPLAKATDPTETFFATGLSLIIHPFCPHAPTSHFNIRFIQKGDRHWYGGGYDLTPMGFPYAEDTAHFHAVAKKALDAVDPQLYAQFSKNAREYFFIKHYQRERGVGGIFFDHFTTGDDKKERQLWMAVGDSFLDAILPIYQRRGAQAFTDAERETQLYKRGAYAEFNLLYDRGTKFGFDSGGNPEAILCSMPPVVKW